MERAIQVIASRVEPNLLDGSTQIEGKGKEGKIYTSYISHLEKKYPEFLPYLNHNELAIYDESELSYKYETRRDKAMKVLEWSTIIDKLPEDVLNAYYTRIKDEFTIKMNKLKTERKKHVGYELGAREFTLTYSPTWFSDEEARKQMKMAIEKLCKYYKDGDQKIVRLRAVGEVGKGGLSHVHCYYQLLGGVKITDKNFRRAYKPWDPHTKLGPTGHKGGHHATVRHHADFLGYIEKEVSDAWLDVNVGGDDPQ